MEEAQSRTYAMCADFEICDSHEWPSSSSSTRSSSPSTSEYSSTSSTAPGASSPGSKHLNAAFLTLCSRVYLGYIHHRCPGNR